jgi:hypothetical protein
LARSRRPEWGTLEYFVSFVFYMLFFGVIAGLSRSLFPIGLGMFFFTNEWLHEHLCERVDMPASA